MTVIVQRDIWLHVLRPALLTALLFVRLDKMYAIQRDIFAIKLFEDHDTSLFLTFQKSYTAIDVDISRNQLDQNQFPRAADPKYLKGRWTEEKDNSSRWICEVWKCPWNSIARKLKFRLT